MTTQPLTITVFGLGEAGSLIAADLAASGADVHAYDPADVPTPRQVTRHDQPAGAVRKTDLVMSITAAVDAQAAIAQAWPEIARGTLYADLSTGPPSLKEDLNDTAALRGLPFADVALMATVPGKGIATPSFVSGSGANQYRGIIGRLGGNVEAISDRAGDAAARKLLRSVVMKGLAALVIESTDAATKLGLEGWLWDHLGELLGAADRQLLERLVKGTGTHATRRAVEMESAASLLEGLGVDPIMSRATAEVIRRVSGDGGSWLSDTGPPTAGNQQ